MRIIYVSPRITTAPLNGRLSNSQRQISADLRKLKHRSVAVTVEEARLPPRLNEQDVEKLAVQNDIRAAWMNIVHTGGRCDATLFDFTCMAVPVPGFAHNTLALAFVAAFSAPDVFILLSLSPNDPHTRMVRALFSDVPNPPRLIYSLEHDLPK